MKNKSTSVFLTGIFIFTLTTGIVYAVDSVDDLHKDALVWDCHNDLSYRILYEGLDIGERLPAGHVDIPRLKEGGVDVQTVYEAMNAARGEAMQQAIEQAVEDGRLTQEQADQMIERLENRPSPEEQVEARKQAIQQAAEDGRMSQEQADWMLQGLEQGWWGGRGFGRGFGPKGSPPPQSE